MAKKNLKSNISMAINDLIKSGSADVEPVHLFVPKMEVIDLWDTYKDTFDDYVVEAINKIVAKSTIYQYNEPTVEIELANLIDVFSNLGLNEEIKDLPSTTPLYNLFPPRPFDRLRQKCQYVRRIAQVKYLGARVPKDGCVDDEVKKLYKHIKEYVDKGYIMGNLARLLFIPFAENAGGAIVSYLIFTDDGVKYLEDNKPKVEICEGQVPNKLDD